MNLEGLSKIELEGKKKSLALIQMGVGGLGTVAGWVYANQTGGRFLRYVGFGFMGGAILGMTTYFITSQKSNKIDVEIDKRNVAYWKATMAEKGIKV
jgi:hypothetical protein|tara:strand:- start:13603 stop:13893 length:291 start_codon:yes stop_codon:yes gene_type:complete